MLSYDVVLVMPGLKASPERGVMSCVGEESPPYPHHQETEHSTGDTEIDSADPSKSSTDDTSSDDDSCSDDSSEMDETECERRRAECIHGMTELENQFSLLKEQLYEERMEEVDVRLCEVRSERGDDYIDPLEELTLAYHTRGEVNSILRDCRMENLRHMYDAEILAAKQNLQSEKVILYDSIKSDLEEKIHRLEEDRNNVDISSDLWLEPAAPRGRRGRGQGDAAGDGRKKAVTVSGPYIVYMLREDDILEDWTLIKKAMASNKRIPAMGV